MAKSSIKSKLLRVGDSMRVWFSILVIALTVVSTRPVNGLPNEDFVHYEDQAFRFSAWFPKTWKKVPTSHSETRLKVVSDAGRGVDDFTIVAMYFDDLNTRPPMILWLGL